jgi:hypothetical protein
MIDLTKVTNLEIGDIDFNDYPDFCDAFILFACYDGKEMTDEQLYELNKNAEFIHEQVFKSIT